VNCPACNGSHLKSAFGCDGIEHTCLDCEATFRDQKPAPMPERKPVAPVVAQPVASASAKTKQPKTLDVDVVTLARQQLKILNAEIKRLKKLEARRDAVVRLLAAADSKPEGTANVRALRSSIGRQ